MGRGGPFALVRKKKDAGFALLEQVKGKVTSLLPPHYFLAL
jgi:hypothetical protein